MDPMRQKLITGLERRLNIKIPVFQGAAILKFGDHDIWLEFDKNSALINIHCVIDDKVTGSNLNPQQMQAILQLNGRHDILRGGWLGIHQETKSLRFFVSIPLQFALPEIAHDAIKNTLSLKEELKKVINGNFHLPTRTWA